MKLQLFRYETFRRHARAFIEPAVIHHWKATQDVNLQRLSHEEKVILGGDMRADSPGIHALLKLCSLYRVSILFEVKRSDLNKVVYVIPKYSILIINITI